MLNLCVVSLCFGGAALVHGTSSITLRLVVLIVEGIFVYVRVCVLPTLQSATLPSRRVQPVQHVPLSTQFSRFIFVPIQHCAQDTSTFRDPGVTRLSYETAMRFRSALLLLLFIPSRVNRT